MSIIRNGIQNKSIFGPDSMAAIFCVAFLSLKLLFLTFPSGVDSTVVAFKSLEELTKESVMIVKGTVTDILTEWNSEHTLIISFVTIRIEKRYKGKIDITADTIVVRQIGGELEGYFTEVVGAPKFTVGEEVVLFLEPAENNFYHVFGMFQGKYRLEKGIGKNMDNQRSLPFEELDLKIKKFIGQ